MILAGAEMPPCPSRSCRYARTLRHQRRRIEIAFGRLEDWRRIATRHDGCATPFFGAIALAVIVIVWLGQRALNLAPDRPGDGQDEAAVGLAAGCAGQGDSRPRWASPPALSRGVRYSISAETE
ncbi:MAG: hypothetical protein K2X11_03335 [Acetobacteraceae bacterium]|nr:hypothetical protein [Acetobacteraceae bacterium]